VVNPLAENISTVIRTIKNRTGTRQGMYPYLGATVVRRSFIRKIVLTGQERESNVRYKARSFLPTGSNWTSDPKRSESASLCRKSRLTFLRRTCLSARILIIQALRIYRSAIKDKERLPIKMNEDFGEFSSRINGSNQRQGSAMITY